MTGLFSSASNGAPAPAPAPALAPALTRAGKYGHGMGIGGSLSSLRRGARTSAAADVSPRDTETSSFRETTTPTSPQTIEGGSSSSASSLVGALDSALGLLGALLGSPPDVQDNAARKLQRAVRRVHAWRRACDLLEDLRAQRAWEAAHKEEERRRRRRADALHRIQWQARHRLEVVRRRDVAARLVQRRVRERIALMRSRCEADRAARQRAEEERRRNEWTQRMQRRSQRNSHRPPIVPHHASGGYSGGYGGGYNGDGYKGGSGGGARGGGYNGRGGGGGDSHVASLRPPTSSTRSPSQQLSARQHAGQLSYRTTLTTRRLVGKASVLFEQMTQRVAEQQALNPFNAAAYVGAVEHRRRVEAAQGGKLQKFGAPTKEATARALPGQLDTALNTLRFVDTLNALLGRGLVGGGGAGDDAVVAAAAVTSGGAHPRVGFHELMAWGDGAVQERFSGTAQYLRSGKKFGLLWFAGEYPHGDIEIESSSVGQSRQQLLDGVLHQPQLIVPSYGPEDVATLSAQLEAPRLAALVDDFLGGTVEDDLSLPARSLSVGGGAAAERLAEPLLNARRPGSSNRLVMTFVAEELEHTQPARDVRASSPPPMETEAQAVGFMASIGRFFASIDEEKDVPMELEPDDRYAA